MGKRYEEAFLEGYKPSDDVKLGQWTTRTFDKKNRMIGLTLSSGGNMTWSYDANSNMKEQKVTINSILYSFKYDYNWLNQNTVVTDPLGNKYRFDYDENGNVGTVTMGNGSGDSYVYDDNNRILSVATGKSDGSLIFSYDYTYDENGNCTRIADQDSKITRYTYDNRGQLLSETNPANGQTTSYTYDVLGNRKTKVVKDTGGPQFPLSIIATMP